MNNRLLEARCATPSSSSSLIARKAMEKSQMNNSSSADDFLDEIEGEDIPESEGVSRIKLLQGGSREVKQHKDGYVPGGEHHVGDYYFRGREPPFMDGAAGFDFIPLDVLESWDEWPADGSGAVIHHPVKPIGMVGDYLNGNAVIYTRHLFLALFGDLNDTWVYAIKKTALAPLDRELVQQMNRRPAVKKANGETRRLPIYGFMAHAGRRFRENAQNDWWVPSFVITSSYPAAPDKALMLAARAARRALPKIGPSIFEKQKGLIGPDRVAILPPRGATPRIESAAAAPRSKIEITSSRQPPVSNAEGIGVGTRPFAPLDLPGDDDIPI
jgi:hypothetical protein